MCSVTHFRGAVRKKVKPELKFFVFFFWRFNITNKERHTHRACELFHCPMDIGAFECFALFELFFETNFSIKKLAFLLIHLNGLFVFWIGLSVLILRFWLAGNWGLARSLAMKCGNFCELESLVFEVEVFTFLEKKGAQEQVWMLEMCEGSQES